MKKLLFLLFVLFVLSGCATYKFQKGQSPYDKGYVASRDDRVLLEYTVGKDDSVPDLELAKERFRKRKGTVEHYYKKMGYITNNFKKTFWEMPALMVDFILGVFRFPFVAMADSKYENNPKYREKVRALEENKEMQEAERIKVLKEKLNNYIQKTLAKESPAKESPLVEQPIAKQEAQEAALAVLSEAKPETPDTEPQAQQAVKKEAKKIKTQAPGEVSAVIIAKPQKGISPLRVQFSANKSHSSYGKIFSYFWEFGDGDTSTEKNPVNTYVCKNFGVTPFTVVLTVKDEKGNSATSSVIIEVRTAK